MPKRTGYGINAPFRAPRRAVAKRFRPGFDRAGVGLYGRFNRRGSGFISSKAGTVVEKKFFDTSVDFSFDNTGEVPATGQLNLIPQGVTQSQRVGRMAYIHSLYVKASMTFDPAAAADASGATYLYLVLDTQANGAAATVANVFTVTGLSRAVVNLNNSKRFRILKKWVHIWNPPAGATTAYNTQTKLINTFIRFKKPIALDFDSTTGAITEIRSNNLFFIAGAQGIDDLCTFAGTVRLRYTD